MLNERLYKSLVDRFGEVKVSNPGEERIARQTSGSPRELVDSCGEQYRVCCPYCNDKRHRLYINHRWNTVDGSGRTYGKYLVHCFNEQCDLSNLENELHVYMQSKTSIAAAPVRDVPLAFKPVELPGYCVPLKALSSDHPAKEFLIKRQFDPEEIAEVWGVHYCVDAPSDDEGMIPGTNWHAGLVRHRLIIPVYRMGKLVGWQARSLSLYERKIKYYTMPGFKKSQFLYNYDRVREPGIPYVVVMEGVTDVWRVGPHGGVALWGSSISHFQRDLLYALKYTHGVCLLLDPDKMEHRERIEGMLRWDVFKYGAFPLYLGGPEDPAERTRDEIWEELSNSVRAKGFTFAFSERR